MKQYLLAIICFAVFTAIAAMSCTKQELSVHWDCYAFNQGDESLEAVGVTCYDKDCIEKWKQLTEGKYSHCGCETKFD